MFRQRVLQGESEGSGISSVEAGAMPAKIGKYCVGVGFRHPVIVR